MFTPTPYPCADCGAETLPGFMVKHRLWRRYGNGLGVLCLPCLTLRVGRPLRRQDFLRCPLNRDVGLR